MNNESNPFETIDFDAWENAPTPHQENRRLALASRLFDEGVITIEEAAHIMGNTQQEIEQIFAQKGILRRKKILVCGGAGFIGSNFIHHILERYPHYEILNYDKLTYAGNLENLHNVEKNPRYTFVKADIADSETLERIIKEHDIDHIINFAAETHVTRSLLFRADEFLRTNVLGVHALLEATRKNSQIKRLIHVSTDEVYGSLDLDAQVSFGEEHPFKPNVPYAAAKAGGDLLARAYYNSYKVPLIVTHCSNNYGPYQHPEKLIPNSLFRALRSQPITLHGSGQHVRDWIFVQDHCEALDLILHNGTLGDVYNVGADTEKNTHTIARIILETLGKPESLITLVDDRPGNDLRYSISAEKIKRELGWQPRVSFEQGISRTIQWYQNNLSWVEAIRERDREFTKYI